MNDIHIHIIRDGICMGDDALEHRLTISFKQYDSIDVMGLLKMIDIWLVKIEPVVWTVSIGGKVLGTIRIMGGRHEYLVCSKEQLWHYDFSENVYCSHQYIK